MGTFRRPPRRHGQGREGGCRSGGYRCFDAVRAAALERTGWEFKIAALSMMNLEHVSVNGELWRFVIDCGPQVDGPALADCLALVGRRCLRDDPARLDDLAKWPASSNKWMRYSALCFTTQWTEKGFDPAPVLEWVRTLAADKEQCVQDMIGDWIRKLGANDSNRRNMFLAAHGDELKPEVLAEGRR